MKIQNLIKNPDGVYHTSIGFPKDFVKMLPKGFNPRHIVLRYGRHAQIEAENDKNGRIRPPRVISFEWKDLELFEIEIENGVVVKMAVRIPHDREHDVSIVFNTHNGFVRTIWLNKKSDVHKSLNMSKYRTP